MPPATSATSERQVDLTILHPMDPWRQGMGGFDTCIDGILRYAPPSWSIEVIGLSANPEERPVGKWTELSFADRSIRFFPALADRDPTMVRSIPLALRFALACRQLGTVPHGKVIQIHRFESGFGIRPNSHQKAVYFFHNHPEEVDSQYSDVRWRRFRRLFQALMARRMRGAAAAVAVDPRTPAWVAGRFPWLDGRAALLPGWADPRLFSSGTPAERRSARQSLRSRLGLEREAKLVAFVGRIERQKDPLMMIEAFAELARLEAGVALVVLGDGRLREEMRRKAESLGQGRRVHFLAPTDRESVAELYRASDVLACTSGFEAGPRVVFEALASGTPVVSFDVGQVAEVLGPGAPEEIGGLVKARDPRLFAWTLASVLSLPASAARAARCAAAVRAFTPRGALAELFEMYGRWIDDDDRGADDSQPRKL